MPAAPAEELALPGQAGWLGPDLGMVWFNGTLLQLYTVVLA